MARIIDIKIPKAIASALRLPENDPRSQQLRVLKKLLKKARFTAFGQQYRFDEILFSKHHGKKFQDLVPVMIIIRYMKNGGRKHWKAYPMYPGPEKSNIMH